MRARIISACLVFVCVVVHADERVIPHTMIDFGFTKGFINRNAINLTRKTVHAQLNLVMPTFFFAPGNRLEDKQEVYPQLSLDPDIALGAAVGVGPQFNVLRHMFFGFDACVGGGAYAAQWKRLVDPTAYSSFNRFDYYYEWGAGIMGLATGYIGFTIGRPGKAQFVGRLATNAVIIRGYENTSVSFPISVSFGFGR